MGDNVSRSNEDDDVGSADGQLKDIVDLQVGKESLFPLIYSKCEFFFTI